LKKIRKSERAKGERIGTKVLSFITVLMAE
jgi:hypothetical protein